MASESEAWWTQHYTVYSIRDLQALPIFNKFLSMHYPFVRGSGDRTESFSSEGTIDTYQWSAHSSNEGEKFWHDQDRARVRLRNGTALDEVRFHDSG